MLSWAFVSIGYSQFGGNPPDCALDPAYKFSQGAKIGGYNNPLVNGCDSDPNFEDDCGIVTPGVGGNSFTEYF
ncbi:MAG: hypothetical protein ABR502_09450 [Chitinophagaceae bacterium]